MLAKRRIDKLHDVATLIDLEWKQFDLVLVLLKCNKFIQFYIHEWSKKSLGGEGKAVMACSISVDSLLIKISTKDAYVDHEVMHMAIGQLLCTLPKWMVSIGDKTTEQARQDRKKVNTLLEEWATEYDSWTDTRLKRHCPGKSKRVPKSSKGKTDA
jgi:hypothetical protein